MSVLAARGLRKSYGGMEVVSGVDLEVAPGECFGLLGPNGAGKTTTLRLCLGLITPDAGDIELLGEPVPRRAREARTRVGVVPQFDNLDPDFTVAENLVVFGRYFGMAARDIEARMPALLEFAGLAGRRMRRLTQEGKTLVLTTHFMEEAERLCQRLAIMDRGRIIAEGSPRALIAEHIEPQVLEVHGPGYEAWVARARSLAPRVERAGDTVFVYAHDVAPIVKTLAGQSELAYLHRQASLEDVFLKLTGRDLRD
jgi:lipooligosaccharide transport system ATP-binding protein